MKYETIADLFFKGYTQKRNREKKFYISVLIVSILGGLLLSLFIRDSEIIVYFKILTLFILTIFLGATFFYLTLNELLKFQSLKALLSAMNHLKIQDWKWLKIALIARPVKLHPDILYHPITLLMIGQYFIREGLKEKGEYFINEAKKRLDMLNGVDLSLGLSDSDFKKLIRVIKNDKQMKRLNSYLYIWDNKLIRYTIVLFLILILILHFYIQLEKIKL